METKASLDAKLEELFEALPLERAMESLRAGAIPTQAHALVSQIDAPKSLLAGLWLYVNDLERSHEISQSLSTPTGSYWHGIMHRREGDFWNSKYWFRQVGSHPAMAEIGYDPYEFVDACEVDRGKDQNDLIDLQRREWQTLFEWCRQEALA